MMRPVRSLLLIALALAVLAPGALAAPKKKYHFELTKVLVKEGVKADVGTEAQPRIEAVFRKALDSHPQLVKDISGAPNPESDANGYRKFLAKKGVSAAYLVTLEVSEASFEIVPLEDKKNAQRIVVS